jgi:hypothetical protein
MGWKMPKIIFLILISIFITITNFSFASEPYTFQRGSPERKAILDTLREGLKQFPDKEPSGIGFEYKREDAGVAKWFIEEGKNVIFIVNYLKVKDNWAWIEVRGENYGIDIDSLLHKEEGKWVVKGLVRPSYVLCLNDKEGDVKAYIYKRFMEKFPQAPVNIFPKVDSERKSILNSLRGIHRELDLIFVIKYLKVKNGWAWIETGPRTPDGMGQFEPIDALLHKEKGKWVIKHIKPCCGEWEDYLEQNNIKSMEGYYRHLMRMFPGLTRDLFPK